ncbi:hypothetical protein NOV72_02620 [Caballeronia novacaledonica]|uniref:Uncharacterized protein n=1 Tax=Caballeronia novacaledonica TaxID=1544861 RepID=A0A2U3I5F8_9BURK|nr:hypothetical protein [Caballeronia novacaledonica]SPB15394.1 hypothetical protein NOV72_02620 [Caballeronia novacaledonica]
MKDRTLVALMVSLAALVGRTFVSIEGDHNTVSDTGGHGGGVQLPERSTQLAPIQRLIPPQRHP